MKMMKNRILGTQGLKVSEIGYGAMGISLAYGETNFEESKKVIDIAYREGVTFFDTAEVYGWDKNEQFLGSAVKKYRKDIVLATKFGFGEYDLDGNRTYNSSSKHYSSSSGKKP